MGDFTCFQNCTPCRCSPQQYKPYCYVCKPRAAIRFQRPNDQKYTDFNTVNKLSYCAYRATPRNCTCRPSNSFKIFEGCMDLNTIYNLSYQPHCNTCEIPPPPQHPGRVRISGEFNESIVSSLNSERNAPKQPPYTAYPKCCTEPYPEIPRCLLEPYPIGPCCYPANLACRSCCCPVCQQYCAPVCFKCNGTFFKVDFA